DELDVVDPGSGYSGLLYPRGVPIRGMPQGAVVAAYPSVHLINEMARLHKPFLRSELKHPRSDANRCGQDGSELIACPPMLVVHERYIIQGAHFSVARIAPGKTTISGMCQGTALAHGHYIRGGERTERIGRDTYAARGPGLPAV